MHKTPAKEEYAPFFARSLPFEENRLPDRYTLEIIPFALRAKGFTVFGLALSASLVFNQYINPIALKHLAWKYYVSVFLKVFRGLC